jgi:hypothetical protein
MTARRADFERNENRGSACALTRVAVLTLIASIGGGCVKSESRQPWREKLDRGEVVRLGSDGAAKPIDKKEAFETPETPKPLQPKIDETPARKNAESAVELPEPPPPVPVKSPEKTVAKPPDWKPLDWDAAKNAANPLGAKSN